jgi:hypothetical protein
MLRKILPLPNEDLSKWALNYEGLYIVKKAFSRGALLMTKMDGEDLIRLVNSDFVKEILFIMYKFSSNQQNKVLTKNSLSISFISFMLVNTKEPANTPLQPCMIL